MPPAVHVPARITSRVIALRRLSATGRELTLARGGLPFHAGQLVTVHGPDELEDRSYTICSGERDNHLQLLFRLIPHGRLTPRLDALREGDRIELSGPLGEFTLRDPAAQIFFFATGTGIAPARSYLRSHPGLNLTLVHGVREEADLFYREEFGGIDYRPCIPGGAAPFYRGRVTGLAAEMALPAGAHYYLCGANEMFYDMRDVLAARGVPPEHIFTEAYYYRADD